MGSPHRLTLLQERVQTLQRGDNPHSPAQGGPQSASTLGVFTMELRAFIQRPLPPNVPFALEMPGLQLVPF